jgi:hypothetical protein
MSDEITKDAVEALIAEGKIYVLVYAQALLALIGRAEVAADEITRLRARVERLEKALKPFTCQTDDGWWKGPDTSDFVAARAALETER